MTIAFQISSFEEFNYHCCISLAKKHPRSTFLFISDNNSLTHKFTNANIHFISLRKSYFNYYWYNYKLTALLKKNRVDCFFSNTHLCSLKSTIRQYIIIDNASLLKKSETKKSIAKSDSIIVRNEHIKLLTLKSVNNIDNKIALIPLGVSGILNAPDNNQKDIVKNKYTEGKDYFLMDSLSADEHHITVQLKSYSLFKKWQKSNLKLLIVHTKKNEQLIKKVITNYKYRSDVVLISRFDNEVISAAYAVIFFSEMYIIGNFILSAMRLKVPVILPKEDYFISSFESAGLYFIENDKDLSEKMINLYKNEECRNKLIATAKNKIDLLAWDTIAEKVWSTIISPDI